MSPNGSTRHSTVCLVCGCWRTTTLDTEPHPARTTSREGPPTRVASPPALLGTGRPSHANRLECVPASDLPTVRLADSLDASMDHPPTRRAIWRPDHLPLSCLVGEAVTNLELRREDLGVGCCLRFALLLGG